jgi:hypothetical protein
MSAERVILVDADDRPLGTMEKLQAHREGRLHRAFSVCPRWPAACSRSGGRHQVPSPGLWSNTCRGHPRSEELLDAAARAVCSRSGCPRRLRALPFLTGRRLIPDGRAEGPRPGGRLEGTWRQTRRVRVALDGLPGLRDAVLGEPRAFTAGCGPFEDELPSRPGRRARESSARCGRSESVRVDVHVPSDPARPAEGGRRSPRLLSGTSRTTSRQPSACRARTALRTGTS